MRACVVKKRGEGKEREVDAECGEWRERERQSHHPQGQNTVLTCIDNKREREHSARI